ncbi:MAG TPA: 4-hydroxy-tetrahydrodipicolinate reductase, partial [Caulobacteraceae bacterium]|nr:4-hydroxy-tetrahydrodipicolinate reductase [Caulobacteraceae bacterium]
MTEAVRIGVAGALGRMGRAIEALAAGRDDVRVCARLDRPGATDPAAHATPLTDFDAAAKACDVIVDFSTAPASAALAAAAAARGGPALVIGATGFSPAEDAQVRDAAQRIAIVRAGNFSLGV